MHSAAGISVALNTLRLRGHSLQDATATVFKVLYSLRSTQNSCKRVLHPEYYKNLQRRIRINIPEHCLRSLDFGHEHVKHQTGMAIASWAEESKRVAVTIRIISSESKDTAQRTSYIVKGVDMAPPKPKPRKKENHEEIPEPGNPVPGFPVPVFPDVAIPFVPELPVPEVPEIPMPQEPGKVPKRESLPGKPRPYLPDSHVAKSSIEGTQDTPMDVFIPQLYFLSNNYYPAGQKATGCISETYVQDVVLKDNCEIRQKYEISGGLMTPLMIMGMLLRNRQNCMSPSKRYGDELLPIKSGLRSTLIENMLLILKCPKGHKLARTRTNTITHNVFGITYEQFKHLHNFASTLLDQLEHQSVS